MKNVKKSKGISCSGICEWGGTLADVETAYYYQKAFDRYFAGITENVLVHAIHGDEAARSTYDKNWEQSQQMISISNILRGKQLTAQKDLRAFGLIMVGEGYLQYLSRMVTRCVKFRW